jgi:hypothetical protein
MSDDRPWWPPGFQDPAFVTQRSVFGVEEGGDYVRGSSVTTLPHTALRYPTTTEGFEDATNKAFLAVRPFDYATAEIAWGWPVDIEAAWSEVALVRSGFGHPVTPNDGQTVFRALKTDFTNTDGDIDVPPPVVYDRPLQPGQFYYYTLFFKTTPYDWIVGMSGQALIPRNHHHSQHLWNTVPPFYQTTDSNLREGNGPLRQFLSIFGFELDLTREYVEQWQEVYHIDKSPSALLKEVGANFGVPYKSGVGDIRYRAMLAGLPEMLAMRGTPVALRQVVETGSKWQCDITLGANIMMLPDDSEFSHGTGNWATMHHSTVEPDFNKLTSAQVFIASPATAPPANYGKGSARVDTTKATETTNFIITVGDGELLATTVPTAPAREIIPLYSGIPVDPGNSYGFAIQVKHETSATIQAVLLWFGAGGQPTDYIDHSDGLASANPDTAWHERVVQAIAPPNAIYMVPALYFTARVAGAHTTRSAFVDIAGALAYLIDTAGSSISVTPPDKYLTMGDPAELIGAYDPAHPDTTGYLLGSPE